MHSEAQHFGRNIKGCLNVVVLNISQKGPTQGVNIKGDSVLGQEPVAYTKCVGVHRVHSWRVKNQEINDIQRLIIFLYAC